MQQPRLRLGAKRDPFPNECLISGRLHSARLTQLRTASDVQRVAIIIVQPQPDPRTRPGAVVIYTYPDVMLPQPGIDVDMLVKVTGYGSTFKGADGKPVSTAEVALELVEA